MLMTHAKALQLGQTVYIVNKLGEIDKVEVVGLEKKLSDRIDVTYLHKSKKFVINSSRIHETFVDALKEIESDTKKRIREANQQLSSVQERLRIATSLES